MITKKEFCRCIIDDFVLNSNDMIQEAGLDPMTVTDKDLVGFVYSSTRLGIALEYLGVLTKDDDLYEYLQNRGGIEYTYLNWLTEDRDRKEEFKTNILSTRELISLLPD